MEKTLHIILTGGTIEKAYDPISEKPEFLGDSVIPAYLRDQVKLYADISVQTICQIDSLQMTDDIRAEILRAIEQSTAQHILVIHGTSTMDETARYLEAHLEWVDQTIVLTGAMIPLKEFALSDGGFNLGFAIAQVMQQSAGVYVCMNGRCFAAREVRKNTELGRFEAL